MSLITFLSSFHLLLVFFIGGIRANLISDLACKLADCGEGSCAPPSGVFLPYDCKCNPGWKQIQIGPLTLPSCTVPNCTLDFSCGFPPPPTLPVNVTDPCGLTWCGDGTCVPKETTYICKCNANASNLLNKTNLACFRDCYFEDDCKALGFGSQQPLPPNSPTPDSLKNGNGAGAGPSKVPNSAIAQHSLTGLLLFGILLPLIF